MRGKIREWRRSAALLLAAVIILTSFPQVSYAAVNTDMQESGDAIGQEEAGSSEEETAAQEDADAVVQSDETTDADDAAAELLLSEEHITDTAVNDETASGTEINDNAASDTSQAVVCSAVAAIGSAVWSDTRTLTVTWALVSGSVSGYELQYRQEGGSDWTSVTCSGTSAVLSLSVSSRYEIRVRGFLTASGVTAYGSWSAVSTVSSRYERTIKVSGTKTTLHHTAGSWSKKNGYKYYTISSTGKKAKKTFLNIKGQVYYFDSKGRMYTGWHKIGSDYYFFNRSNGKMSSGKTVEKVKLTTYGTANKKKSIYIKRVKVYIAAREFMEDCTKATDSKSVKLRKCFKALFPYPYYRYRKLSPIYKKANWELDFANDIFVRGKGCCVSLAAAFAYLARECGYKDVYIGHDTSHAWTMVNGYVYDPLFAEARGWSGNYHGSSKSDYRTAVPYKREI